MKKLVVMLFVLLVAFAFVSCTDEDDSVDIVVTVKVGSLVKVAKDAAKDNGSTVLVTEGDGWKKVEYKGATYNGKALDGHAYYTYDGTRTASVDIDIRYGSDSMAVKAGAASGGAYATVTLNDKSYRISTEILL